MDISNIDIDTVRAKNWQREVQTELDETKELLQQVYTSIQEIPGEKDVLLNSIYDIGTNLQTNWTTLCDGFDKAIGGVGDAIDGLQKGIEEKLAELETLLKSLHN